MSTIIDHLEISLNYKDNVTQTPESMSAKNERLLTPPLSRSSNSSVSSSSSHSTNDLPHIPGYILTHRYPSNSFSAFPLSSPYTFYIGNRISDGSRVLLRSVRQPRDGFRLQQEFSLTQSLLSDPTKLHLIAEAIEFIIADSVTSISAIVFSWPYEEVKASSLIPKGGVNLSMFFPLAIGICEALQWVHQNNIIHGNVQPGNFLVKIEANEIMNVRVVNFASAMQWSVETSTATGYNFTDLEFRVAYISPEQTGRTSVFIDYRTDLYSLGLTLYQFLTGEPPFNSSDALQVIHMHLAAPQPSVLQVRPDVPLIIAKMIQKLMSKSVDHRYQSAFGVRNDLVKCWELVKERSAEGLDIQAIDFPAATNDISTLFRLPTNLYGRAREIEQLRHAIYKVADRIPSAISGRKKTHIRQPGNGSGSLGSVHSQSNTGNDEESDDGLQGTFDLRSLTSKGSDLSDLSSAGTQERNGCEVVVVSGAAGMGKTAVVLAVQDKALEYGLFASGKFEQRNIQKPYGALIDCVTNLIHQILSDTHINMDRFQLELKQALAPNAQVFVDIIPELEVILGNLTPVVESLPSKEAHERLKMCFITFIAILTRRRMMTIFLDDFQWADTASLDLVETLCLTSGLQNVLLIIGHRDGHPQVIEPIFALTSASCLTELKITPIDILALKQLIADTLHIKHESEASAEKVIGLADLVFRKTFGVTMFALQFLATLYREGFIRFNWINRQFEWSIAEIEQQGYGEIDTEFLVSRLTLIPPEALEFLKTASCNGPTFTLQMMNSIVSVSANVVEGLRVALRDGFIVPDSEEGDDVYRFYHDSVQKTVYSLLSEEEKEAIHLQIGNYLCEHILDDKYIIYDAAHHLNKAKHSVKDKRSLRELNFMAGVRAKTSTVAFESALEYFLEAASLLPENYWEVSYREAFSIKYHIADCYWTIGDFTVAFECTKELVEKAQGTLDRCNSHILKANVLLGLREYAKAVETSMSCLTEFGWQLPEQATGEDILPLVLEVNNKINTYGLRNIEAMERIDDPIYSALMEVLSTVCIVGSFVSKFITGLAACKLVLMTLNNGLAESSLIGFLTVATLIIEISKDNRQGVNIGKSVIKLTEKIDISHRNKARIYTFYYSSLSLCESSLTDSIPKLIEAHDAALIGSDIHYVGFSAYVISLYRKWTGLPLQSVYESAFRYYQTISRTTDETDVTILLKSTLMFSRVMINTIPDNKEAFVTQMDLEETEILSSLCHAPEYSIVLAAHLSLKLPALYYMEFYDAAIRVGEQLLKNPEWLVMYCQAARVRFYYALALFANARKQEYKNGTKEFGKVVEIVNGVLKSLRADAHFSPVNILHICEVVKAELSSFRSENSAIEFYNDAASLARKNKFPQHEALITELIAKHYFRQDHEMLGSAMLNTAIHKYQIWGCTSKVSLLIAQFTPHVFPAFLQKIDYYRQPFSSVPEYMSARSVNGKSLPSTASPRGDYDFISNKESQADSSASLQDVETGAGTDEMDFMSVLKAVNVISKEFNIDRLLPMMMHVFAENAGAERALCILLKDDKMSIKGQWPLENVSSINAENDTLYCEGLVKLISHTKKPHMIENAAKDPSWLNDQYIRQNSLRSLMCIPILQSNEFMGCIYLESTTIGAFSTRRTEAMMILSNQLGISIAHGRLINELQKANAEITQLLEREKIARKEADNKITDYKTLIEYIPNQVWVAEPDGRVVNFNKQVYDYFGLGYDQLVGAGWLQVIHPDDRAHATKAWIECLDTGKPYEVITRHLRHDGKYLTHLHRALPLKDKEGNILKWFGTNTSIEDQLRSKEDRTIYQQMVTSELRFRKFFETNLVGLFFGKEDGTIIDANKKFISLHDPKGHSFSLNWREKTHPDHKHLDEAAITELHTKGISTPYVKMVITPDGPVWVMCGLAGYFEETDSSEHTEDGEMTVIGFLLDHTKRKAMEEELIEARETALQGARLKGQFLANMSHELRTPFTGVLGMINLLAEDDEKNLNTTQREYIETCQESCLMLLRIIDSILDFSKLEAGKVNLECQHFSPEGMLEKIMELLMTMAADKGLEIGWYIDKKVPPVLQGDPGRLRQILMNLVGNGVKFTHVGEVFVRVSLKSEEDGHVMLLWEVMDTGIGLDDEDKKTLYKPFSQVDSSTTRVYGGTGLGLSICKQLVELMQGEINVKSRKGKGSNFWFTTRLKRSSISPRDSRVEFFLGEEKPLPPNLRYLICTDSRNHADQIVGALDLSLVTSISLPDIQDKNMILVSTPDEAMAALTQMLGRLSSRGRDEKEGHIMLIVDLAEIGHMHKLLERLQDNGENVRTLILIRPASTKSKNIIRETQLAELDRLQRTAKDLLSLRMMKPIRREKFRAALWTLLEMNVAKKMADQMGSAVVPVKQLSTAVLKSGVTVNGGGKKGEDLSEELRGVKILIAEDNPLAQKVIDRHLQKYGFKNVTLTQDGEEVVKVFKSSPTFDIILMDLHMPIADGIQATKEIRAWENANNIIPIPIIALTADVQQSTKDECIEAGMQGTLSKPADQKEIIGVFHQWGLWRRAKAKEGSMLPTGKMSTERSRSLE